jgi:hypothetical protein
LKYLGGLAKNRKVKVVNSTKLTQEIRLDVLAESFSEALEAFRTTMSYRFVQWLNYNRDVFASYKASLGFVWV